MIKVSTGKFSLNSSIRKWGRGGLATKKKNWGKREIITLVLIAFVITLNTLPYHWIFQSTLNYI